MSTTSENTGNFELCIQPELGGQKGDTSSRKPMCICRISGIYPRTRWGDAFPLRSKQFRRIPGSEARGEDHMGCIVPWSSIHTPREGKIKSSWPDLVSMARRWKPLKLRSPQFSVRVLKIPYWPLQLACLQVPVGGGRWSWLLCGQRVGGAEGPGGEGAVPRYPLAPGHLLTRW